MNCKIRILKCILFTCILLVTELHVYAQNECSNAVTLTSNTACNNTNINLSSATASSSIPLGCWAADTYTDYWYQFTAVSTTHTVTLSNLGTRFTNPRIQIYSGTCGSLISVVCGNTSGTPVTATATGLTIGATYYIRVAQMGAWGSAGNYKADICVTHPVPPPANDDCSGSVLLTSSSGCTNTAGSLFYATPSTGTIPTGCSISGTVYEVWYRYVATATSQIVRLSSLGTSLSSSATYVQMFSSSNGTCGGTLTSLGCSAASSALTVSSLTVGTTYYIRVFVQTNPVGVNAAAYGFNICVQQAGGNDLCANAIQLISSTSCNTTAGTLFGATYTAPTTPFSCGGSSSADVWYRFIAQSTNPTITFTNTGGSWGSGVSRIVQIFQPGTCGLLTSISCNSNPGAISTSGLTVGQTYFIRVTSSSNSAPASNWTFTLCVQDNTGTFTLETAKGYVNVSKQTGGGSIDSNDILEIRATFSLSNTSTTWPLTPIDSVSFFDTLKAGAGFRLITGTLAMRTNEGKIFGSAFTEAAGDDAGFAVSSGAGTDTIIRLNFGAAASSTTGGSVTLNNAANGVGATLPKTAANNYLIIATYRVRVNRSYGTRINFGGGSFRFRNRTTGSFQTIVFPRDSLIVYASPSICPNAVSASNVIGDESNGTFGSQTTGSSPTQNRNPSPNTTYSFLNFTANSPNDNYYGITSNTAAVGTVTNRNLAIPAAAGNRVFTVWDISGDHTGAADPTLGNPPCNTTLPVSPTNPCGYMMVFNAAYKMDTAFQFNVANACPNTYYEVSAWLKNVCYKCGQDAEGDGQWTGAAYNPTGPNDTTGVRPNISIKVNNLDYYNTGDIQHMGSGVARMSTTADTANRWHFRAFVYRTDSVTNNFTLTFRNNAPGGGGNDWAIDDISFKTCSPTLQMTPSSNTTFCNNNQVNMQVRIATYYDLYRFYQWERSTDGGNTWHPAPESPAVQQFTYTQISGEYRDTVSYPSIVANATTNGYRYRIRVATTNTGIANSCAVFNTDDVIVVSLASSGCTALPNEVLKFNAQLNGDKTTLNWTAKEEALNGYEIERSDDGVHFRSIGYMTAKGSAGNEVSYLFNDPVPVSGKVFYRLKLDNTTGNKTFSNTLNVTYQQYAQMEVTNLVNPFRERISFQLNAIRNEEVQLQVTDALGKPVYNKRLMVFKGSNAVAFEVPQQLSKGSYLLRVISSTGSVHRIIQKQ